MELKEKLTPFKDSKIFGVIKDIAPAVLDGATDLVATAFPALAPVNNLIDKAIDVAKKNNKPEQVAQLVEARADYEKDYLELFTLEVSDRKDARKNGNVMLQNIVAIFSLVGFTFFGGIQVWVSYEIMVNALEVNEFVIMTASNIFGLFTGLIFTLKDFLFGGSADKTN